MKNDYYQSEESVKEYIKAAEGYNGKKLIDKLNTFLPSNSSLLEIGSGPGTDFKILSNVFNVTGSDFSQEFVNHLNSEFPNAEFLRLNAASLTTNKTFDAIYSNKVLHHLTDTELRASIKRQSEILNSGGIICHSFWKGVGDEEFKGMFVNYHNAQDIEIHFSPYFEMLLLDEYAEFETGDSLLLTARKK